MLCFHFINCKCKQWPLRQTVFWNEIRKKKTGADSVQPTMPSPRHSDPLQVFFILKWADNTGCDGPWDRFTNSTYSRQHAIVNCNGNRNLHFWGNFEIRLTDEFAPKIKIVFSIYHLKYFDQFTIACSLLYYYKYILLMILYYLKFH